LTPGADVLAGRAGGGGDPLIAGVSTGALGAEDLVKLLHREVSEGVAAIHEDDRRPSAANGHSADRQVINAGVYVLDALAKDPAGIAYANFLYAGTDVKTLALARDTRDEYWEPTPEAAFRRDYPLTRFTTVFLDRARAARRPEVEGIFALHSESRRNEGRPR